MNLSKLTKILSDYPDYRLDQAKKALFQHGISSWREATSLPSELRELLDQKIPLEITAEEQKSRADSTVKSAIRLKDNLSVEAVLMQTEQRKTVCVSTQVGCPLSCEFCATGQMDYKRDLDGGEIIDQVLYFLRRLPAEQRVDNVVFMGMGEPFLNYDASLKALRILNDENCFNIGARNLSVSTAGLPKKIRAFAREDFQVNLAVSLHAGDNDTRSKIMPINKRHPLEKLLGALDYYVDLTGRKVMYEYIPLKGINDSTADINKLAKILEDRLHYVNLIPYNPTGSLEGVTAQKLSQIYELMIERGLNAGIRRSFGQDIKAACGQLANRNKNT